MTPQVWPDWHSIGYDDNHLLRHSWHGKIIAWEALGDHTFDLLVTAPPSVGLILVDLPFTPVITGNVTGPSTNMTTKSQDKGGSRRERKEKVPHDVGTLLSTAEVSDEESQVGKGQLPCEGQWLSRKMMKTQLLTYVIRRSIEEELFTSTLFSLPSPVSMVPPESTLPPLIDLSMEGMAPTPPTVEDASAIEGLLFVYSEVHLEGQHTSGKNEAPGDLGNLVPAYNSDGMDVEVNVEEDDMVT
ncbi:hypothetical protein EDB19DRAFT_1911287 [Suillus lakei]|nr:hypothetical protein EDB19DRAFT_1911287 [Suillus lakei]